MSNTCPSNITEYEVFFSDFAKLVNKEKEKDFYKINIDEVKSFFTHFNTLYQENFILGAEINVWELAGLKHDELRNCAVLAWLLDAKANHGQGDIFFKAFLDCLYEFQHKKLADNQEYYQLIEEDYKQGYSVTTEKSHTNYNDLSEIALQKSKNRVDFVIENTNFLYFMEAKIDAHEGNFQLLSYAHILKKKAGKRKHCLIYLTPTGLLPEYEKIQSPLLAISWKQLARTFEKVIKEKLSKEDYSSFGQPFWAQIILQFCKHIKKF